MFICDLSVFSAIHSQMDRWRGIEIGKPQKNWIKRSIFFATNLSKNNDFANSARKIPVKSNSGKIHSKVSGTGHGITTFDTSKRKQLQSALI